LHGCLQVSTLLKTSGRIALLIQETELTLDQSSASLELVGTKRSTKRRCRLSQFHRSRHTRNQSRFRSQSRIIPQPSGTHMWMLLAPAAKHRWMSRAGAPGGRSRSELCPTRRRTPHAAVASGAEP
jgi:hypothetical protein